MAASCQALGDPGDSVTGRDADLDSETPTESRFSGAWRERGRRAAVKDLTLRRAEPSVRVGGSKDGGHFVETFPLFWSGGEDTGPLYKAGTEPAALSGTFGKRGHNGGGPASD